MSLLETLGILFILVIALNALIGIFAMKNAIPEETINEFAHQADFNLLKASKI